MRIDRLHIQNFLGIRSLEVDLETPVTLIAGHNGAGKSSVADALRLASAVAEARRTAVPV